MCWFWLGKVCKVGLRPLCHLAPYPQHFACSKGKDYPLFTRLDVFNGYVFEIH